MGTIVNGDAAEKDEDARKSRSVSYAIAILRHLSAEQEPRGVTAIARALGLSPSSAYNILKTLVAEEFVDFDAKAKSYSLGWGPLMLARRALDPEGALALVLPEMDDLAGSYNVACSLGRITRDDRIIMMGSSQSDTATRIQLAVGHRTPVLAGASGRAVAAAKHLGAADIVRKFRDLRWQNAPSLDEYLAQVDRAKVQGWASDQSQMLGGVTSIAVAIIDTLQEPRYVLTATMFSGQYSEEMLAELGAQMVRAAHRARLRLFALSDDARARTG